MIKSSKTFIVTDETLNIYGFKVRTAGIDMSRFKNNPVCTYNHDYTQILGLWEWGDLRIEGTRILAIPSFDENDENAMKVADKIEQNIIKTASIGIVPLRISGDWVEESELLEIAIAPIPGNKNATVQLYSSEGDTLSSKDFERMSLSINSPIGSDFRQWTMEDTIYLAELSITNPENFKLFYAPKIEARSEYLKSLELNAASLISTNAGEVNPTLTTNVDNNTFLTLWKNDPIALSTMEKNDPVGFSILYNEYVKSLNLSVSAFN